MTPKLPRRLYKYREFDERTLEVLCEDRLYFADPALFNDPLDCNPSLTADSTVETLRQVLAELVRQRVAVETKVGLSKGNVSSGPAIEIHVEKTANFEAGRILSDIAYLATDPEYGDDVPRAEIGLLTNAIEKELMRRYGRGVCSFGTQFDSPLMWSHYGAEHRGLCLGYSPTRDVVLELHPVVYGGNRSIQTSTIAAMVLDGDQSASLEVDSAVLLRKASQWRYEREWRLLGFRGLADSPLELEEVIFGLRSSNSMVHTVMNALSGREREVLFYLMVEVPGTFKLKRWQIPKRYWEMILPKRSMLASEIFTKVSPDLPSGVKLVS